MTQTAAWGTVAADQPITPMAIDRRALRDDDVAIAIQFCGVCHSDLHQARNDWGGSLYPLVPGHEIAGVVSAVGAGVTGFKPGDRVAVGCMVDSCLECEPCRDHEEQYCERGMTGTYNGKDRRDGSPTYGGYSKSIVVREEFVLRVPDALDLARAAPLLCAGITSYSPLRQWGVGPGSRIGVVGLGGLGHMGVKLGAALGAEVTMITTSPGKAADARALGASDVLISTDDAAMQAALGRFDFILDTVPVRHDVQPYLKLLKRDGSLVIVGAIAKIELHTTFLLGGRKRLSGSGIGGIRETQELLDFCAEKGILPDCEMIRMDEINHAYERMERSDVKYRFVIDMATL
ncbi:NAD(P)-dependent alcohol dehydrogenase [Novosphingobium lentum]|uniref:NAD(P)-dependent alcohol dehydrogenase n=1 Tax=Novosphingobium lentum TaxID=145287 RepID=UPI000833BF34|nr:NAD(P)-dependent alcohol dehydrogenase [Novosphingobium lentum]